MRHSNESYDNYIERLSKMTKEDAMIEVANDVYRTCLIFEAFEGLGAVRGNGHHMAQNIAKKASDLMEERWIKK